MKTKIWVLATVLADENAPALPAVFTDEAEAWAKADEAQDRTRKAIGAEWSRWELTGHDIEICAAR
jgi:hypothetical protein